MKFDILCFSTGTNGKCTIKTEKNLIHSLLSNAECFPEDQKAEPHPAKTPNTIKYSSGAKISVKLINIPHDKDDTVKIEGFYISCEDNNYESIEPKRLKILDHIKHHKFDKIYITKDDVSKSIAEGLYPKIYEVENSLRSYLMTFMVTRIGTKWWEITATSDYQQKAQGRKNNEKHFAQYIDNRAYLIDFGELGKLIYEKNSGFNERNQIVERLKLCNTVDDLEMLKQEIESNYQKFFKENFKDVKFQEKWEDLERLRHKIAHNNLFINQDKINGNQLADELLKIIETALGNIDEIDMSAIEKEVIKLNIPDKTIISEKEFFEELMLIEDRDPTKFVGVSWFIRECLAPKDFDDQSSYDVLENLILQGKIERYEVPFGARSTPAIKTIRKELI